MKLYNFKHMILHGNLKNGFFILLHEMHTIFKKDMLKNIMLFKQNLRNSTLTFLAYIL